MSRFTKKIKNRNLPPIQIVILAAGIGSRTRSYEPRCLLKYNKKTIIDTQIEVFTSLFNKIEISVVGGFDINKIIKKVGKQARVIENQIYETTNNAESLRIGINNSLLDNIIFIHGDLVISPEIFNNVNMNESFILIDSNNKFDEKEVGVTVVDNIATVFSYNLPTKWCQIAYLAENELSILKKLFQRQDFSAKTLLTFEILNKVIENGGKFNCFDIGNSFIKEIDSLKDINNEYTR